MLHFFQLVKNSIIVHRLTQNQKQNILDNFTGWKNNEKEYKVNLKICCTGMFLSQYKCFCQILSMHLVIIELKNLKSQKKKKKSQYNWIC